MDDVRRNGGDDIDDDEPSDSASFMLACCWPRCAASDLSKVNASLYLCVIQGK